MDPTEPTSTRPELLLAATLYLMTAYRRAGCPRIAACIAAHLERLVAHEGVDPLLRDMCAGIHAEWRGAALPPAGAALH